MHVNESYVCVQPQYSCLLMHIMWPSTLFLLLLRYFALWYQTTQMLCTIKLIKCYVLSIQQFLITGADMIFCVMNSSRESKCFVLSGSSR
jgi:hypothetical protein